MGRARRFEAQTLGDLKRTTSEFSKVERRRDDAILRAHLAGNSLRVIAEAAGLSHETVRTIVERMQGWLKEEQEFFATTAPPTFGVLRFGEYDAARRQYERRAERLQSLLSVNADDTEGDDA